MSYAEDGHWVLFEFGEGVDPVVYAAPEGENAVDAILLGARKAWEERRRSPLTAEITPQGFAEIIAYMGSRAFYEAHPTGVLQVLCNTAYGPIRVRPVP